MARQPQLPWIVGVTLVVTAVLVLDAVVMARAGATAFEGDPPGWLRIIGWIVAASGLLLEIGGLVVLFRANRRNRSSPLREMSVARNRELVGLIRRGGRAPADELPVLRHTAEQLRGQTRLLWSTGGLALLMTGQALFQFGWFWLGTSTLLVVAFGTASWLLLRDARRADAFLRAHPGPEAPDGAAPAAVARPDAGAEVPSD